MDMASTLQLPARVEALSGLSAIPPEYVRPADERADLGDAFDVLARDDTGTAPRIPVVDISPFLLRADNEDRVVEAVRAAAADWGVMHIAGHGIPAEVMDRLRAAGAAFFALPIHAKEAYANDPAAGRLQGYGSRLAANASGQREWEDYLFHLVHPDALAEHALWPAHPPGYVAATREFGRRIREVASALLAILSTGLLGPGRAGEGAHRRRRPPAAAQDQLLPAVPAAGAGRGRGGPHGRQRALLHPPQRRAGPAGAPRRPLGHGARRAGHHHRATNKQLS